MSANSRREFAKPIRTDMRDSSENWKNLWDNYVWIRYKNWAQQREGTQEGGKESQHFICFYLGWQDRNKWLLESHRFTATRYLTKNSPWTSMNAANSSGHLCRLCCRLRRHLIQMPEPHYLSSLRSSLFSPDDRAPHPIFKREPSHFVGNSFPSLGPQIKFFGSLRRVRDNRWG